jgi:hypothetical protein
LTLDFFSLGFFAAVVETLLLSAGEGLLLFLREVSAFFFDSGSDLCALIFLLGR